MAGGSREERLVAAGRGKWSQAGVPHRGWECVDIEDLGRPLQACEMCEAQMVRYVHYMEHPHYPDTLAVGCVCAGNMEGDLVAARERESMMQSRAGKRTRWLNRKGWRRSLKGNSTIFVDGFRVTVYERGGGWAWTVAEPRTQLLRHANRDYETRDHAKLAAFDFITRVIAADA